TGTEQWATAPQRSSVVKKTTSSSSKSTATAAKSSSSRPSASKVNKPADTLVKATYNQSNGLYDGDDGLSAVAKPISAKTPSMPRPAEAKSPPVNLGVLRLLNSKRITFHYEVKDPASAGVAGLEMWGTNDTRSWKKYDIVKRAGSSLVVDVKDEGLYGFSMIARGKGELAKNQPPQSGEPPQVWVAVDLTKPIVQLLGAELNIMATAPALVIRWNAKDRNFGPRPITLLYADRLEGPWTPVAANVENSGRYEWVMPSCVPSNVFVRVQAIDLMGNAGMAQTTTLHIPGRSATSRVRAEPKLAEPPQLGNMLPTPPCDSNIHPVAAIVPNPAVSILSVDNE
ncbi:MAG: hypothetical protein ACRELF_28230, partial [Gemmataceae bacterium]